MTCVLFEPIKYSRHDTGDTQSQVRQHNAAWDALCIDPAKVQKK